MNIQKKNGFTLIELMVATALGLFLMWSMTTIFINNKNIATTQSNVAKIQDDSSFSLFLMNNDIALSGFRGCSSGIVNASDGTKFYNVSGTSTYFNSNIFLQGFQGTGTAFSPTLPSALTSLSPAPSNKGDVLTIRTTTGEPAILTETMTDASSVLEVSSNTGLVAGSNAIISNCFNTSLFKISTVAGNNITPTASLNAVYSEGAQIFPYDTITYYVANEILYKVLNSGIPEPIAYNVEKFSVLYGIDMDGNLNVNKYLPAPSVGNFNQVLALRLGIVIKSSNSNITSSKTNYSYRFNGTTYTPNDGKLRKVYFTTIALRNMLP